METLEYYGVGRRHKCCVLHRTAANGNGVTHAPRMDAGMAKACETSANTQTYQIVEGICARCEPERHGDVRPGHRHRHRHRQRSDISDDGSGSRHKMRINFINKILYKFTCIYIYLYLNIRRRLIQEPYHKKFV